MPTHTVTRAAMRFAALFALAAVVCAGAVVVPAPAAAQTAPNASLAPAPGPPPALAAPPILGVNDPANPLHLTAAQQKKRNQIIGRYRPQIQGVISNSRLSAAQKQAKVTAIIKSANAELLQILTPSQRAANTKMEKDAAAREARLEKAVSDRRAQLTKLQEQVNKSLTAAQKKKLAALGASAQKQVSALVADKTMTPQQKQQKYMAIGQSYTAQAKKIYTPAQLAAIDKMRKLATTPLLPPGTR